ncbi:MAG: cysteine protease [Gammaproteobacteria bacterium RIFCSPLOWO2_02_FULL_47_50]|nr:MAG: cysteine protease [Gammaproteobacteria bacterium RIFCSPLOWO2_01_FULL_47_190]OGT74351.1 MAG: cysteine protease [Gammaproteobacteria bacterium RIFCSPLOWO2_12_47_11]OGT81495.1 MAG: cysteine protease [Gammaproteobacteria bacterium RIFCSPLOWO2_02_FULL_47_50]OGT87905.1 MAG: cysteine protease [Gammaproteobacteria bacterium RIFCSPLOWO2_12_FULL_47_76]
MQKLMVSHLTEYTFANFVTLEPHRLLLRPREGHDIRILSSRLDITPAYKIRWHRDVYDNNVATVTFQEAASSLSILSEVTLEHYEEAPLDFVVADYAVNYPFQYQAREESDLAPYLQPNYPADQAFLHIWLEQTGIGQGPLESYVLLDRLSKWIAQNLNYRMREEPGVQTPGETLSSGSGSCRDYAALYMEICRLLGLACRFVSGYLHASGTGIGYGSTHAWTEVYLPGPGWKGFDPTIGELTAIQHIPVAVARHPEWIPPVAGSFVGSTQTPTLTVNVQVNAL